MQRKTALNHKRHLQGEVGTMRWEEWTARYSTIAADPQSAEEDSFRPQAAPTGRRWNYEGGALAGLFCTVTVDILSVEGGSFGLSHMS